MIFVAGKGKRTRTPKPMGEQSAVSETNSIKVRLLKMTRYDLAVECSLLFSRVFYLFRVIAASIKLFCYL